MSDNFLSSVRDISRNLLGKYELRREYEGGVYPATRAILSLLRESPGYVTAPRASGKTTALIMRAHELRKAGIPVSIIVASEVGAEYIHDRSESILGRTVEAFTPEWFLKSGTAPFRSVLVDEYTGFLPDNISVLGWVITEGDSTIRNHNREIPFQPSVRYAGNYPRLRSEKYV